MKKIIVVLSIFAFINAVNAQSLEDMFNSNSSKDLRTASSHEEFKSLIDSGVDSKFTFTENLNGKVEEITVVANMEGQSVTFSSKVQLENQTSYIFQSKDEYRVEGGAIATN